MKANKVLKKSVYILTEGFTEQAYFSRIAEIIGEDIESKYSIKVDVREIISGAPTDPINMVKEAKKAKRIYNEVWLVFDKDRERDKQNEDAISQALKAKINVAFSSIAFEHWIILHFEKNDFAFLRSDCESRGTRSNPVLCTCNGAICACSYLRSPGMYPGFRKGRARLYDDLCPRNATAIENAAWLRRRKMPYTNVHLLNPYTDVDILLCELLNEPRVTYCIRGDEIVLHGMLMDVTGVDNIPGTLSVKMRIKNTSHNAFVINNNTSIHLTDLGRNQIPFQAIQANILQPGDEALVNFDFNITPNTGPFLLRLNDKDKYTLIEI